jgi:prepilin-type N-terminal cleavage/methylation domain-containing protein/prepilin-type processing-associated H-X9-DG protein
MKHLFKKQAGFTLIELLVTIAVISLLAAILFPVFARARENARRSGCMSNLKQLALGIIQYTQDYDERYPASLGGPWGGPYTPQNTPGTPGAKFTINGTAHIVSWMDMIFPYVKSVQIFECPSQPDSSSLTSSSYKNASSYGYNSAFGGSDNWQFGLSASGNNMGNALSVIQRPAEVAMLSDYQYLYNHASLPSYYASAFVPGASDTKVHSVSPHFEGTNLAFADGHVKWMKPTQIIKTFTNTVPANAGASACQSSPTTCVWLNPIWNPSVN